MRQRTGKIEEVQRYAILCAGMLGNPRIDEAISHGAIVVGLPAIDAWVEQRAARSVALHRPR